MYDESDFSGRCCGKIFSMPQFQANVLKHISIDFDLGDVLGSGLAKRL